MYDSEVLKMLTDVRYLQSIDIVQSGKQERHNHEYVCKSTTARAQV